MTFTEFNATLNTGAIPGSISPELQALWYAGKNDWERSHEIAQDLHTMNGSWIHAFLHRQEGDDGNARYWYRMAGKSFPAYSLEEEWKKLVEAML